MTAAIPFFSFLFLSASLVLAADSDADGLEDAAETGTGVYVSPADTGTNPDAGDSDGDGVPDGLEVLEGTNPNASADFKSFSLGLVGYYSLNGSGTDLSASGNSATMWRADFEPDRFDEDDSAAGFNGQTQYVDTTDSAAFQSLGSKATISFWVLLDSGNASAYLISKDVWAGEQWGVIQGYGGSGIRLFVSRGANTPGFFSASAPISFSKWTHCALVLDGAKCRVYANGLPSGSTDSALSLPAVAGAKIRFGGARTSSGGPISQFKGLLDDIRIYNRPLEASEVLALHRFESRDRDGDGIRDIYETGTGVFVSAQNTGTSPDNPDTDGDDLSDGEETTLYRTNPNRRDSDGDGFDDLFEIRTGFDPVSAFSTPEAESSVRTAIEFRFNAAAGAAYRIEGSVDLKEWSIIEPEIQGNGTTVTRFYSIEASPSRYFRARRNLFP